VKPKPTDAIAYAWTSLHAGTLPSDLEAIRYRNPGANKTTKANWTIRTRRRAAKRAHRFHAGAPT